MQLIKWNPWPSFPVTLTEDAPNLQAASELRMILLSDTVDSFWIFRRASLAAQALSKGAFLPQALLRGIPLAVCLLLLPIISVWSVFKCLSWHSRKTQLVSHVTASRSQGCMAPSRVWFVKLSLIPRGHFFTQWPTQFRMAGALLGMLSTTGSDTVDGLHRRRKDTFCNVLWLFYSVCDKELPSDRGFVYSTHL